MLGYHAGRVAVYGLMGVAFGLLGKGLQWAGFQQFVSVFAGLSLLAAAFFAWRFERLVGSLPGLGRLYGRLQGAMSALLQRPSAATPVVLGMLNGLLPCGMVYAALAGAIASTNGPAGGLFMLVFGLGTLPLLLAAHWLGRGFGQRLRRRIGFVQPLLLLIAGLLLLQRGWQLDLSLFESAVPKADWECH
jgi:sulfite exporter TauE/SafE